MSSRSNHRIYCGFRADTVPERAAARLGEILRGRDVFYADADWSNLTPQQDPRLLEAQVVFGQPPALMIAALGSQVRWLQLTSAGYSRYDQPDVRAAYAKLGLRVSNSSSVYADPCAQHLLALLLADARCLPAAFVAAGKRSWESDLLRRQSRLLTGARLTILGYGAISRRLIELLAPFEADIVVVRRNRRGDEPVQMFSHGDLGQALRRADHLLMALPSTAETKQIIDARRLALLPPHAAIYNVGRGDAIDQAALMQQLEAGALRAAYLDVTDPDPLPAEHELWQTRGVFVTPHSAGGRDTEFVALIEHFGRNLQRYDRGEPLLDRVLG